MATEQVSDSGGTDERTAEFVAEWRNAAYNCYSSGHKFCREVCPVMQVTRDEAHTPTSFHANVVAMEKGHLDDRGRGPRLRPLHAVRRVRAALPEHALHRRLLPLPHAHGRPRQGGARARGRERHPPAALAAVERAHRRAQGRARPQRDAGLTGARGRLGRGPRPADRRRDRPLLRLRGGLLPHDRPARGGADPQEGRRRVRPHAGAVVLRRAGRGDGLRRPGAALRRAQRGRLARSRREADPRASTRTTTSPSPRTTRATSARTSTIRDRPRASSSSPS